MPDRVRAFHEYLARGEWELLRRAAHQLKGAAGSYGFAPISPAAGALESAVAATASEEEILRCVEELAAVCSRARAGLPE